MGTPLCDRCYGFGDLYEGPPYDAPCPKCGGSGLLPRPNLETRANTAQASDSELRARVEEAAHRRNLQTLSEAPCVRLEPAP